MKILEFYGQDAVLMSIASNRQLEVSDESTGEWSGAMMWRAAGLASRNPERVRLVGPARTLAESVLGQSLPRTGKALWAQIEGVNTGRLNAKEVAAIDLILAALA